MTKPKPPADLWGAGRRLWRSVTSQYDVAGVENLLAELCKLADRLQEIRDALNRDGLMIGEPGKQRRHPLADLEVKVSAQFQKVYKQMGLSDDQEPKRNPGRPSAISEAMR